METQNNEGLYFSEWELTGEINKEEEIYDCWFY